MDFTNHPLTSYEREILDRMRQIVARKGADHVYEPEGSLGRCFYFRGGQPDCLIGHLIHDMGLSVPSGENGHSISHVGPKVFGPGMTEPLLVALKRAQWTQDHRYTWGAALKQFEVALYTETKDRIEAKVEKPVITWSELKNQIEVIKEAEKIFSLTAVPEPEQETKPADEPVPELVGAA